MKYSIFLKRIISFILSVCLIIPTLLFGNMSKVKADSTDLANTYISLMNSAKITEIQDIENLTQNDLKVISLFLSNFYSPFNTALDSDMKSYNLGICVDVLTSIGLDQDAAKTLVSTTMNSSLTYMHPLFYKANKEYYMIDRSGAGFSYDMASHVSLGGAASGAVGGTPMLSSETYSNELYRKYTNCTNTLKTNPDYAPLTVFSFWALYSSTCAYYGMNEIDEDDDEKDDYIINFYASNGNVIDKTPVFRFNHAFCVTFGNLITEMKTSWSMGYLGNAMINTSITEVETMDMDSFANLVSFTEPMYVDWVGNIIADVGDKRVIVVPAVLNPCAFVSFDHSKLSYDSDGNLEGGEEVNYMVSTFGIKTLVNHIVPNKFNYNEDGTSNFFKLSRNNTTKASWDNSAEWGGGDVERYMEILEELDIDTGERTSNKWGSNTVFMTIPNEENCVYVDTDKMVWTAVTFDAWTNMDEDSVVSVALVDDDYESQVDFLDLSHNYFETTDAYTHNDNFEAVLSVNSDDIPLLRTIFLTYVYLYKNGYETGNTLDALDNKMSFAYMSSIFPQAEGNLTLSTTGTTEEEVTSFIYFLLHPTKGAEYFVNWIKNKVSALFVGWHEDIVGGTNSNVSTGMTKYVGFSGYITIPNIQDIEFLDWLMTNYDIIIIYLILVIIAILFCYVLVGQLTIYRAFVGIIMFSILSFLPPRVMTYAINTVNVVCDSLYSNKFDYWAVTQNQAYLPILASQISTMSSTEGQSLVNETIREGSSESGYSFANTSDAYTLVKIKWETPKRMNDIYKLESELAELNKDETFSDSFMNLTTNVIASGDTSEQSGNGNYIYRNYMDLYTYSSVLYNIYSDPVESGKGNGYSYDTHIFNGNMAITKDSVDNTFSKLTITNPLQNIENDFSSDVTIAPKYDSGKDMIPFLKANLQSVGKDGIDKTSSLNAINNGFLYSSVDSSKENYYGYKTLATSLLVKNSDIFVPQALRNYASIYKTTLSDGLVLDIGDLKLINNYKVYYGLQSEDFQYTVTDVLVGNHKKTSNVAKEYNKASKKLPYVFYSCYTESPYYFFNFNIRDQLIRNKYMYSWFNFGNTVVTDGDGTLATTNAGKLVSMFLSENSSYFHNTGIQAANDGYGHLRDFMNFHDLFYYVIPLLNQGNKTVDLFDTLYDMHTYDDCSYKVTSGGSILYNGKSYTTNAELFDEVHSGGITTEETYKLWHDMNVYSLFNLYTDWVHTMYDCDYADGETIMVSGKPFYVENPIDPTCYFALDAEGNIIDGRYMVFSRSEMAYYGLDESDLTEVELKCIQVQDNVYKNTLNLMNYNTFNDETLIQAYSMIQLFEFNKAFSQKSLVSTDYILYPQSFELKTFSLDAYMRLILAEASGETLMANEQDGANKSIYIRILENTSLFFGVVLLINDFICVYVLPGLRFIFLVVLFFMSVAMIIAGAIKLYEDTGISLLQTCMDSLVKPLLKFVAVSVGLAYVVSLFMYDGPTGVTSTNSMVISFKEPTLTVLLIACINIAAIVIYWNILTTSFKDLVKYIKAISASITGAVTGTMGTLAKTAMGIGAYRALTGKGGFGGAGNKSESDSSSTVSNNAETRGKNNSSPFGAIGGVAAGGVVGGALGSAMSGGSQGGSAEQAVSSTEAYNKGASKYNTSTARGEAGAKEELKNEKLKAEQRQSERDSVRQGRTDKANASRQKAEDIKRDHEAAKGVFKNKNGNAGMLDRAFAGVDMVKTGVQSKLQNMKAGSDNLKAQVANGVGSRLDGLVDTMNGSKYKMQKSQMKVDNARNERQAKLAGMKNDAIQRNNARYASDKANKQSYHAKAQNSGRRLDTTFSNTQARNVSSRSTVNNVQREEKQNALKNRTSKSGIVLPY